MAGTGRALAAKAGVVPSSERDLSGDTGQVGGFSDADRRASRSAPGAI